MSNFRMNFQEQRHFSDITVTNSIIVLPKRDPKKNIRKLWTLSVYVILLRIEPAQEAASNDDPFSLDWFFNQQLLTNNDREVYTQASSYGLDASKHAHVYLKNRFKM